MFASFFTIALSSVCNSYELAQYTVKITVFNETIEVHTNKLQEKYDFIQLTSEVPVQFDFDIPEGVVVLLNNQQMQKSQKIKLERLHFEYKLELTIKDDCNEWHTLINTLSRDFPPITCEGYIPYDGYIYGDVLQRPNLRGHIFKADKYCNLVFYRSHPGLTGDFKRVKNSKGEYRYIFNYADLSHPPRIDSYAYTKYRITDTNYNVLKELSMIKYGNITEEHFPTQSHDMYYFDDNHFFVDTYFPLRVTLPNRTGTYEVLAAVIEEVIDDKVVMFWNSSDYPELYTASNCPYTTQHANDHMHTNTLQIDPLDNSLIASFRLQDAVIKINRTTGKTIWIMGGKLDQFGLTINQKSSYQHYAHFDSGSILMFDNGNRNKTTRILRFWIDEKNMKLVNFTEQVFPYKNTLRFSEYCGSVQYLGNDHYFIAWGKYDGHGDSAVSLEDFRTNRTLFKLKLKNDRPNYRSIFVLDEPTPKPTPKPTPTAEPKPKPTQGPKPEPTSEPKPDNNNNMKMYIIIGSAGGGLVLAIIVIVICVSCRKKSSQDSIQTMNTLLE